jgi:hypothetical protein
MKIYLGNSGCTWKIEEKLDKGYGVMISSPSSMRKYYHQTFCALDNGAYSAWTKGYGFDEYLFLKQLSMCIQKKLKLDFVVSPDIVAGGVESVYFSIDWARRLVGHPLYFAVQDGMQPEHVNPTLHMFKGIFIGGTLKWKLETGQMWVEWAHSHQKPCHIGRVGTFENLRWAKQIGADSVDSTTFTRNDTMHIIEHFNNHQDLFLERITV